MATTIVIIIALAHDQFKALGARGIHAFGKANQVLYDIKYLLDSSETDGRL
ncbi:MAG: UDP-N-acetyl-D-galactosamine dehydrogenase [Cycloclasticus sp.]|jgi:UDP-N-acetyl-D-galactosamine dehydrogenase